MRHVLLAIFVFFASMPLQASCGDMHHSQEAPHSQHGDMMDHGGMDMDCCDHEPIDTTDNCDPMSHCGASASGLVMIGTSAVNVAFINRQHPVITDATPAASRFDSPPFRPPIV